MKKLTGGQAAVEALKIEQVKHVFGLIGSSTMEMFDALYDAKEINYIGIHDERTGAHMADGYARASGKAGVILAGQNGPGATNLITGLSQASAAYSPVISIAGSISTEHVYRDGFQEVDQQSLFKPVTKKTWTVPHAERIPEMFREAFRVALAPRKGPVQLNLPRNILAEIKDYPEFISPQNYRNYSLPAANKQAIDQASQLLIQAKSPVIVVGGGIKNSDCNQSVIQLAEFLKIPMVTSPGHGDAIAFTHPLNAGQMGPRGNIVASNLVKQSDIILALGTRLGFNATFYSYDNVNKEAKIIQVEIEPTSIGRYFPITQGIWGDANTVAQQLLEKCQTVQVKAEAEQWTQAYKNARQEFLKQRDNEALINNMPIHPSGLFKSLRQVIPENAAITMDAGTLCLQATDALNYYQPKSLFTPLDFGLVGFSYACGLGVKLAQPERPVISLMGDGGFGMTVSEISTAVDHNINTLTLVMNNQCWGSEKAYQRDFFGERYIGADVSSPNFAKLAELYGAKGYNTQTLKQTEEAIADALTIDKPCIIDISMDPKALYSFRRDSFKNRGG